MPDIQSELTKVFDDWEEDAKTYQPDLQPKEQLQMKKTATHSSLSKTVFSYVLTNPHRTTAQHVHSFQAMGHNGKSVVSLLSQMVRNNLLSRDANGRLVAVASKYRPLQKTPASRPYIKHKQAKVVPALHPEALVSTHKAGIDSLYSNLGADDLRTHLAASFTKSKQWSPESIMDTLTRGQAKELHAALAVAFNLGEVA
jgi:hypothetical protein